jgi:hypothetical protein
MYQSSGAARPRSRYNNLYAKLGISPDASPDEIQAAYRVLEKAYRPDGTYADDVMHQAFLEISGAAVILGNRRARKLYDRNYIDETGRPTQAGLARTAQVRKAAIFSGAFIALAAGLLIVNFGGPAPEANRKSVLAGLPPQKIAAAEPPRPAVSPSTEPDTKTEANKPGEENPNIGASAQASVQDYLPPVEVIKPKNGAAEVRSEPIQAPGKPRRRPYRQYSHAPDLREQDVELSGPLDRGRIAASDSPVLKSAQCLACLTDDRVNCSKTCP